jgi:hypothetical protein
MYCVEITGAEAGALLTNFRNSRGSNESFGDPEQPGGLSEDRILLRGHPAKRQTIGWTQQRSFQLSEGALGGTPRVLRHSVNLWSLSRKI